MNHKTKYHKHQIIGLVGFILGTFGISPLVKDAAATQLGMHNYLLFSLVIGCVCLFMIPLLADTFTSSQR